jgi:hypothetical protein
MHCCQFFSSFGKKNWRAALPSLLLCFSGVTSLSGCDAVDKPSVREFSRHQCAAATALMTKKLVKIKQKSVEDKVDGADLVVTVRYDMIPLSDKWISGNPADGVFVCYFPLLSDEKGREKASRAREMMMNGTRLSKRQVENLNTMVSLIGSGS